jgi:hypothetical protein
MPGPPVPLQISYIDPDNNVWNLSDLSLSKGYVCSAISGIEGLPTLMQTFPLLDGTAIPNVYVPQPGSIILAILIERAATDNPMDYYNLLDAVVRAFVMRRNELPAPGYIQVQRPDGSVRQIAVYTTSGLNTPEVGISDHSVYTLTLQTPDPFWTDVVQQELIYTLNTAAGILPLLPVQFAGNSIIGTPLIINVGTALSYPTWTITGPGQPTITNNTTDLSWSLNTPIPSGQTVQVVTKPGQQLAVNVTTGVSVWDQLVLSSLRSLWPLVGGSNQVTISMSGATAGTSVELQWVNRWSRA